jgi:hypothetical protein
MTTFHYTETTPENTSENTLPPLTPSSQPAGRRKDEEDEEKEIFYSEQESSNREADLCPELVCLWNQIVQDRINPGSKASLTAKRRNLLEQFLSEILHDTTRAEKIDAWKNYCILITRTRFLTGQNPNGFKVTLDWALVTDNACKVLEGAYYDKPAASTRQPDNLSWEEFSEELAKTLPGSRYLAQWVKMSVIIARFIGQAKYRSWFAKVVLSEVTETKATFLVEGQFTKDLIVRTFSSEIRCAVQSLYPRINELEFRVISPSGDRT